MVANKPAGEDVSSLTQYRGGSVEVGQAPDLKLIINPDADFASLATLLHSQGCRITAGPSAHGEIWVVVDDKQRLDEVKAVLSQSKLIDDVAVKQ